MTKLPKLTEAAVRQWTGGGDFERGKGYYRNGYIQHPIKQGMTLKAQCLGSMPTPYRIQVTLTQSGIGSGVCSCPVGYGCKHTVALLLTWIHHPETFAEVEEMVMNLEQHSKEELIAIIQKMLERAPELETIIELQTLSQTSASQPISPATIRHQTSLAMNSGSDEWGAGYEIRSNVLDVVATGDTCAGRQDWANAVTVYATVAETVLDEYDTVYDDEGEVLSPVHDCVNGLGLCLPNVTDTDLREIILQALFDIYRWDMNFGGVGLSDEAPFIIREQATPEEKILVAAWVRKCLSNTRNDKPHTHQWRQQAYGSFLLSLEADTLDDEAYLRICRETGRTQDYVNRLLDLERVAEAITTAQKAESDWDLLTLAGIFTQHGYEEDIFPTVAERAQTNRDIRLKGWLREYAQSHRQPEQVLQLAQEMFWMHPSLESYQELKSAAEPLKQWKTVRQRTQNKLALDNRYVGLLIRIHLADNDVAHAIQVLQSAERRNTPVFGFYGQPSLRIQVAQAAENEFPRVAIEIYTKTVFRLIDARGRQNYATAAQYLLRMRKLYTQTGEAGRFTTFMQNLRDNNKSLRALKDELKKAGL